MKKNKHMYLGRWVFALICLMITHGALMAQKNPQPDEGVIRIKFQPTLTASLKTMKMRTSAKGEIITGLSALDALNQTYQVTDMKRVFRPAGKFESKHERHGLHLWYEIKYNNKVELNRLLNEYQNLTYVQISEPTYEVKRIGTEINKDVLGTIDNPVNDPLFGNQWHYENTGQTGGTPDADVDLTAAWMETAGTDNVIVSIHDGGIDFSHEDIAGNEWINADEIPNNGIDDDSNGYIDDYNGYNFGDGGGPIPADSHGTHVGGTVAAQNNNGVGVSGVSGGTGIGDGTRLMSLSVFGATGNNGFADSYAYAADNGAIISQNSWGYTSPGVVEQAVLDGIDYFIANAGYDENDNPIGPMQGGIVIFAAGNDNADGEYYPGYYDPIFTVSGLNHKDEKSWYTNYGTWVDIAAPGGETNSVAQEGVLSTTPGNNYSYFQGTSMACPHVSGLAALIVSKYAGNITPDQVRGRIMGTADFVDDKPGNAAYIGKLGIGRINAAAALMDDDGIAPDAITDLSSDGSTQNKIMLTWTAPADADNNNATSYDLRYSTAPIDAANFADATSYPAGSASNAGETESVEVEGLSASTMYYFAVKSADVFGNVSDLSNVLEATTTDGPEISVTPSSISTAIDVQVATTITEQIVMDNLGTGELDYSTSVAYLSTAAVPNTVLNIDRSLYGLGNTDNLKIEKSGALSSRSSKEAIPQLTGIIDSLFYDVGEVEDDFVGFSSGAPFGAGSKFTVSQSSFKLTHIKNLHRTLTLANPTVVIEVYGGGTLPTNGTLLHTQTFSEASADGSFFVIPLDAALDFSQGDVFWIVFKYPNGIAFPQGVNENISGVEGIFYYSGDDGATWSTVESALPLTAYKTRALSASTDGTTSFISIAPASGVVPANGQQILEVTFDASSLKNGLSKASITIESNDANMPSIQIPAEITVSGQAPSIEVSSNFVEFGSVFVGATGKMMVDVTNNGLGVLDIQSLSFSNPAYSTSAAAGTIDPGGVMSVEIEFSPTAVGNESGKLTIASNDPSNAQIQIVLAGTGANPPVIAILPESLEKTLNAGEIGTDTVTIENQGAYPLTYSIPEVAVNQLLNQPNIQLNNTSLISTMALNTKDDMDTRVGHPVVLGAGVDSGYGYKWIDSDETGGPVYSWMDISATGTPISIGGDGVVEMALPFAFPFYDEIENSLYIAGNGFVTFEPVTASFGAFSNGQIPDSDNPNALIAAFWDDIEPQNGTLHYQTVGNKFILQYSDVPHYSGGQTGTVTFQIVLYSDGNIEFIYNDVEGASFTNSCTIGIENSGGTDGAQVVFNNAYLKNEHVVRFIKPQPQFITSVSPLEGVLLPGETQKLALGISAEGLNDGVYQNNVDISSNDPINSPAKANVVLTVIGEPAIEVSTDHIVFDTLFTGLQSNMEFEIANPGTKTLEVTDWSNSNSVFSIVEAAPLAILPGGSAVVTVVYSPIDPATDMDSIVLNNNAGDAVKVYLSGVSVDPPVINASPSALALTLDAGSEGYDTLTIENTGGYELRYSMSATQWLNPTVAQSNLEGQRVLLNKEALDDRIGSPVQNGAGADNTYGYTWEDNQDGDGAAVYKWTDISQSGASLPVGGDGVVQINMPFDFDFYGQTHNSIYVGANGLLSFQPITASFGAFSNQSIPGSGNPNAVIAPFWDDIEPASGNGLFFEADADKAVFQYDNVPHYSGSFSGTVTFQVILYADGEIKFQYKDVEGATFNQSGTVGIENLDGTDGINVAFNTAYIKDKLAVSFVPPVFDKVAPGTSQKVAVKFDASNLYDGVYEHNVTIKSNDPVTPVVEIPATLTVLGVPDIYSTDSLDFGSTYVGNSAYTTSEDLMIENRGTKTLEISQIFVAWVGGIDFHPIETGGISIAPGESFDLSILFAPQELGLRNGILVIQSNDPDTPNHFVSLTGEGVNPAIIEVTPNAPIVLNLRRYEQTSAPLAVGNVGEADLEYTIISENALATATPDNGTVASGLTEAVDIQFDAANQSSGDHSFNLVFESNDIETPVVHVAVEAHINYLPTVTLLDASPADMVVNENESLMATFLFDDMDGHVVSVELLEDVENTDFYYSSSNYEGVFKFDPDFTQAGDYTFNLVAIDDMGDSLQHAFNVVVENVNRTPVLVMALEDHAFSAIGGSAAIDLGEYFVDPDGDNLTFEITASDMDVVGYSMDGTMLTISGLAQGNSDVMVKAMDSENAYTMDDFHVVVSLPNHPPHLTGDLEDLTMDISDDTHTIDLNSIFEDPDGDALAFTVNGWDDNALDIYIDNNNQLMLTPLAVGQGDVVVHVTDNNGGLLTATFQVTILDPNSTDIALGNFPNPFNGATNISFQLNKSQKVRLEVYNTKGDLMAVLVDATLDAGSKVINFNGQGLEKGLYLYKIITEDGTVTRRMAIQD